MLDESENSNNDDNDNDHDNESGSIFGKQCSALLKANKARTPGEPAGHRNCLQIVAFSSAFSANPDTVTELSETPLQYHGALKYLFSSKTNKATKIFLLKELSF